MLLIVCSILALVIYFILEYLYCISGTCDAVNQGGDFKEITIAGWVSITIVILLNLCPFVALILRMWLHNKGNIDYLLWGFLQKPSEGDRTTIAGSHMLDDLREELEGQEDMLSDFRESKVRLPRHSADLD